MRRNFQNLDNPNTPKRNPRLTLGGINPRTPHTTGQTMKRIAMSAFAAAGINATTTKVFCVGDVAFCKNGPAVFEHLLVRCGTASV
jgi:hypothetical protein